VVLNESPEEKIWRMRGAGNGSLSSCPAVRKLPVQKGMNMTEEVKWWTI